MSDLLCARPSARWALALSLLALACGRPGTSEDTPAPAHAATATELAVRSASPFSADSAMRHVRRMVETGPRVPGTEAHARVGRYLVETLRGLADTVVIDRWTHVTTRGDTLPLLNVAARFNPVPGLAGAAPERVLYVAHWDTRPVAEKDPDPARRARPIAGANDGAAAVGMLLEVARHLHATRPALGVDLLLVDGEDWGDFRAPGTPDVLLGSRRAARALPFPDTPYAWGVVWDLVGARDAWFGQESASIRQAPSMIQAIWEVAYALGYQDRFREVGVGNVLDDHVPLQAAGLPVGVVIHTRFAAHHQGADTLGVVDPASVQMVGNVALMRLYARYRTPSPPAAVLPPGTRP